MGAGDQPGTRPFAASVWRYRSVPGAFDRPRELDLAEFLDSVLRVYPGYTLASVQDEDAHDLFLTRALVNPKLGQAEPDDDDGE